VREQVHELAELKGPPAEVLERLGRQYESFAPESVAALRGLIDALESYGVDLDRVELDFGFGRGIGFYSQMIFEIVAQTPEGPMEVCGGGRYDGLARVLGSTRDDRGVGFACGLERLLHVLDLQGAKQPHAAEPRGCLVTGPSEPAGLQAVRMITQLRALNGERWLDDGPLLIAPGLRPDEAKAYARARGLAAVVCVGLVPDQPRLFTQFDWVNGAWVEVSTRRDGLRGTAASEGPP
jgi:histidyl-tRNA synthetase